MGDRDADRRGGGRRPHGEVERLGTGEVRLVAVDDGGSVAQAPAPAHLEAAVRRFLVVGGVEPGLERAIERELGAGRVGLRYGEREGGERAHGGEEGPHHLARKILR